ncbi:transcriptional regulator [Escherichia coli]|nr:transcriptional regulator [Escherichia coli]
MLQGGNKDGSESDLSAQRDDSAFTKNKKCRLSSSSLSEEHFWMLVDISPLHSEKVICALRDFLVFGYTRREVCDRYNVSLSYFSIALGRISHVNYVVLSLVSYYDK